MDTLLILADDVTGAADCAGRCRQAGLAAAITLERPRPPVPRGALAFTSDSRHLPPHEAAARVREAAEPLRHVAAVWYKKIDSTLRGNLGSELDALLDALDAPCAIVCPAFPEQGRLLRDGYLQAPQVPSRSVHLPFLLAQQSRRSAAAVSLDDVRGGRTALAGRLREAARGAEVLVVDAITTEDLCQILDGTRDALPEALLCGSAGLVGAVAQRMPPAAKEVRHANGAGKPGPVTGPALVVVGSGTDTAHRQIEAVCRERPTTRCVVVGSETDGQAEAARLGAAESAVVLHLPKPEGVQTRLSAQHLADVASAVVDRLDPGLLVLVGGDTAAAVLTRLGIRRLDVLSELLPGIPETVGTDGRHRARRIILKPGGFGEEDVLPRLLDRTLDPHAAGR